MLSLACTGKIEGSKQRSTSLEYFFKKKKLAILQVALRQAQGDKVFWILTVVYEARND